MNEGRYNWRGPPYHMIIHALQTGTSFELEIFRIDYRIRGISLGTGIGYRNEARVRMKGRYGTGWHLTSLIKTIGGEFSDRQRIPITIMRILAYNRSYPKTVLDPVSYPLCSVPGYDVGKVQKLESLELYAYLTLF